MFCPNCGATLSDDAQFCGVCGLNITPESEQQPMQANSWNTNDPAQNTAQDYSNGAGAAPDGAGANPAGAAVNSAVTAVKNAFSKIDKKILIAAGAAIVVVALIIVIIVVAVNNSGSRGGITFDKIEHSSIFLHDDSDVTLFIDGKAIKGDLEYDDDYYYYDYYTEYYDKCSVVHFGSALYKVDGDKLKEIQDEVSYVTPSAENNAVVYVYDDELYLYKDGKETKIYDDAEELINLRVSPNGNTVMFTIGDYDDFVTYIYKGSKAEEFSEDYLVSSVSDDASVIFATKGSSNFSVILNEKEDDAVTLSRETISSNVYSKDGKSVIFMDGSSTYYYAPGLKDNEAIKVCGETIYNIVYPLYTASNPNNFTDFIAETEDEVRRYVLEGDKFTSYRIVKDPASYTLSGDGKTLLYKDSKRDLYSKSTTNDDAEAVKIASDVYYYAANSSLDKVYILTTDDELRFSNGKNKSERIKKDVKNFSVSSDGVCCYIDDDDTLYTTSGKSEGTKVDKMRDVEGLTIYQGLTFVVANDGEYYLSNDGKNFESTKISY